MQQPQKASDIPTGVIPITHEKIKESLEKMPLMQKVSPIVRKYLMEMPHARLERFNEGDEIKLDDPYFNMDFIYVLKGSI